jgi:DNA-binding transcriptional ArsR family regulator
MSIQPQRRQLPGSTGPRKHATAQLPARPLGLAVAPPVAPPRAPGRATTTLQARDLEVLRWSCEQYAARADHVQALIDARPRTVQRVMARLREAGLIEAKRLLVGDPQWAIPTSRGLRTAGQGFALWRPRIGLLAHVAAVNDVRLHIAERSPESAWVPERLLAKERAPREHLPDALVITREDRRVAIEVELTVKSKRRVRALLDELSAGYDTVLYFCAPMAHRQLSGMAESGRWPKLTVRVLPGPRAGWR